MGLKRQKSKSFHDLSMLRFTSIILIIGVNPYVELPDDVLLKIFQQAAKDKGPIPVRGKLNSHAFKQTLVKYAGGWKLYLNTPMRKNAGIDVGDRADVEIEFDPDPRMEAMHPAFALALSQNPAAKIVFEKRPPSHQKEILRYLNSMKTEASLIRNIEKVIQHLLGEKTEGLYPLMRRKDP